MSAPAPAIGLDGVHRYIQEVKNSIELCITKYMSKEETVTYLCRTANIRPIITSIIWAWLRESNPEFFNDYAIRLQLLRQIKTFNNFLNKQAQLLCMTNNPPRPQPPPPRPQHTNFPGVAEPNNANLLPQVPNSCIPHGNGNMPELRYMMHNSSMLPNARNHIGGGPYTPLLRAHTQVYSPINTEDHENGMPPLPSYNSSQTGIGRPPAKDDSPTSVWK